MVNVNSNEILKSILIILGGAVFAFTDVCVAIDVAPQEKERQINFIKRVDEVVMKANRLVNFNGTVLIADSDNVIYQTSIGFADKAKK